MRGRSMRLLLGVSLCALASGCNIKSQHDDSPQAVITPPLVQNSPGTALTANANSGFLSSTVTGAVLGAPLAFVVDKQTQNATITQYTNGNIGLSAPDISPTKTQDQVTFTSFFSQQTEVQAAGGLFATGTSAAGASVTLYQGQPTLDLQYSDFGIWTSAANNTAAPQVLGAYAVGNATTAAGLPKTGSVVFTGNALGTITNTQGSGVFGGLASLTVNFATNSLIGSISDIRAATSFSSLPTGSVNAIGFSGSITGATFSGQTSVASGAGTSFDITGATGTFGGGFYGTSATEAAGVFSLTGGSTQAQVMGAFGATQSFSSNTISSAVPQLSALPNGSPLNLAFNSGFVSASQTVLTTGTTQTTTLTLDGTQMVAGGTGTPPPVPAANFVYYSNGTVSLQAPDLPYYATQTSTATNQTVQFSAASFNQAANATTPATWLPYGTVQATATSSVPGAPQIPGDQVTLYRVGGAVGLQYSDFGEWTTVQVASSVANTLASSYGFYGTGVATPTSQMPTTGSALYTGSAVGVVGFTPGATTSVPTNASMTILPFTGVAEVNVNFATQAVGGGIYGLRAPTVSNPLNISDVLFTGGTITGNSFSGKTSAGTNSASISLGTTATGTFGGGFYGPGAKEIAGTFSLGGTSAGSLLIGSFGAHK